MVANIPEYQTNPNVPDSGMRRVFAKEDGIYEQNSFIIGNVPVRLAYEDELGQNELGQLFINESGDTLYHGDVVILDTGYAYSVTTTTATKDLRVIGVVAAKSIVNDASGLIHTVHSVIADVNIVGSVAIGDWLSASSTVKKAFSVGPVRERGAFAVALSSGTNTTIRCMLYTNPELTMSGTFSYFLGGSLNAGTTASSYSFRFTHATAIVAYLASANLPAALLGNSGIGNTTLAGYSSGGTPTTFGVVVSGYKIPYSTEITSLNSNLAVAVAKYVSGSGASATTKGYIVGGNNGASALNTTDKCTYSTDTMSVSTPNSANNYNRANISDGITIYSCGGSADTITDRITVATDVIANWTDAAMPAYNHYNSLSFSTTGYLACRLGGGNYSHKIPFATGIRENLTQVLTQSQYNSFCAVNATNGWFIGDNTSPFTQSSKFTLSTETYTIDNGAAMPLGRGLGAYMTNGAY